MNNYSHIFIILALVCYAVSAGLYVHAFPKVTERQAFARAANILFIIATLALTVVIVTSRFYGYYTQTSGLILVAAISWITIIGFLYLKIKTTGAFVAPFVTLVLLAQFFTAPRGSHVVLAEKVPLAGAHILFSVLGEAFAICACVISVLYLRQQRALKRKQLSLITEATPPIDKLDRIHMITLWVGFCFITLGLVTGAIYTQFFLPNMTADLALKIIWALAVWLWYLAILLARNIFNFSGKKIARMSLAGFFLLALSFFGLNGLGAMF